MDALPPSCELPTYCRWRDNGISIDAGVLTRVAPPAGRGGGGGACWGRPGAGGVVRSAGPPPSHTKHRHAELVKASSVCFLITQGRGHPWAGFRHIRSFELSLGRFSAAVENHARPLPPRANCRFPGQSGDFRDFVSALGNYGQAAENE